MRIKIFLFVIMVTATVCISDAQGAFSNSHSVTYASEKFDTIERPNPTDVQPWEFMGASALNQFSATIPSGQSMDLVGQRGGTTYAVEVSGNTAYIGLGPRLIVLDISDKSNPIVLGKTDVLDGYINDLALQGNFIYATGTGSGLYVIDVSNKSHPEEVGFYATPSPYAWDVEVSGSFAYVTDWYFGLQIVNIANPSNPYRIASLDTADRAFGVDLYGSYALIASGSAGLYVVNVSNPYSPFLVSSIVTGGSAFDVETQSNIVYLGENGGVRIINLVNPYVPYEVGFYQTWGVSGIKVSGSKAYICIDWQGIEILDVTNPSSPSLISSTYFPGGAEEVEVEPGFAFIASRNYGLRIISIANPGSPQHLGVYSEVPGYSSSLVTVGNHAFVVDDDRGLQIYDISNPSNVTETGAYDTADLARAVAVNGDYAYVADYNAVRIIDISDPVHPFETGHVGASYTQDLVVSQNLVYATDFYAGIRIIDVSDPYNPVQIALFADPAAGIDVVDNYVYYATENRSQRICALDVSNPGSPILAGCYTSSSYPSGIQVHEDMAYVANGNDGLLILDVSNPYQLSKAGAFETSGFASDVELADNRAFVASGDGGVYVVDVSNPQLPVGAGYYNTAGRANGITVQGTIAHVTDIWGGLVSLHYTGAIASYHTVSGRVVNAAGDPVKNVRISNGIGQSALSDVNGYYTITGVPSGRYTLSAEKHGYVITPNTQTVHVISDLSGIDFSANLNVAVVHFEYTQAIQCYQNSEDPGCADNNIPLVANKPTIVRAYLESLVGEETGLYGTLHVSGDGGATWTTIEADNAPVRAVEPTEFDRANDRHAFRFTIPPEMATGTVKMFARAFFPGEATLVQTSQVSRSFNERPSLRIGYVKVADNGDLPNDELVERAVPFMRVYPVSDIDYFEVPYDKPYLGPPDGVITYLKDIWTFYEHTGWPQPNGRPDMLFAWGPHTVWGTTGNSDPVWMQGGLGRVAYGTDDPENNVYQVIMAHEIAHNLGLQHPTCENLPGYAWPYGDYAIHDEGYDGGLYSPFNPLVSAATDDFMIGQHCGAEPHDRKWISAFHYRRLYDALEQMPNSQTVQPGSPSVAEAQPVLLISGDVYSDTTATINSGFVITTTHAITQSAGSAYCLQLLDQSDQELSSSCFDLTFLDPEWLAPVDSAHFIRALPFDENAVTLVLKAGNDTLASSTVSAHAPTVELIYPNTHELLSDLVTVEWSGGDLDGDDLNYIVSYSADGGVSWIHLAIGLTQTTLTVDTSRLPGSDTVLFRVIGSDGFHTVSDVANEYSSVASHSPAAVITAPSKGSVLPPGPVIMQGYGTDPEDGLLNDSSLVWLSDVDGLLGSGNTIVSKLSVGFHEITLQVTDSDGNITSQTIRLHVGYQTFMPISIR
ncbi:MAG: carboxypeptidase regulatory-like domain-containing protein [Ardenticatenaceae bacterium]|nr:carboxypeptidase regulatory-like domain-containing protein [Ardenticatenaceae bacterium]